MSAVLEVDGVSKIFGGLLALDRVSFQSQQGNLLAIIGPNGAGKSTMLNVISGVYQASSGQIRINGQPISHLRASDVATLGVARTFQNVQLFDNMTLLENVMAGRHSRSRANLLEVGFRLPWAVREEQEIRKAALEALDAVGLAHKADLEARSLPLGEQKLLEIARALATEPALLLMDEPGAGLSTLECGRMAELAFDLCDRGMSIILIEHDMELVMSVADWVVVLDHGQKIAEGRPEQVQQNETVIKAYLGEDSSTT